LVIILVPLNAIFASDTHGGTSAQIGLIAMALYYSYQCRSNVTSALRSTPMLALLVMLALLHLPPTSPVIPLL
jgi:hypothetical protein